MKEKLRSFLPSIIICGILLLADIAFAIVLAYTAFFSGRLMGICLLVLMLHLGAIFALTYSRKRRVLTAIGGFLAFLMLGIQILGYVYIGSGIGAIKSITGTLTEYSETAVYVKTDDPAEELSDIKDYNLGILNPVDYATTEKSLVIINEKLGSEIKTTTYTGLPALLDGILKKQEIDAILLNKGFIDTLEELPGHEEDMKSLRELAVIQTETEIPEPEKVESSSFTVYISGIDTTGPVSRKSRSDVNILATFNTETGEIALVTTPRDYYVQLALDSEPYDKLTHAGIYGVQTSSDTLAALYGTKIDYYFRLNFDGFKDIIDALGGVTVNSLYNFSEAGFTYKKGENFVNGEQALAFARCRYKVPGGDYTRGLHQMEVIKAVINKITSVSFLANYHSVLDKVSNCFDSNIPYEKIAELVRNQLDKGTNWKVESFSVNGRGASRHCYSLGLKAYVVIPYEDKIEAAKALINRIKNPEEENKE